MNLEKLIESHYAPKKGNDLLVKLIESKLNEVFDISVPELTAGIARGDVKDLREAYKDLMSTPLGNAIKNKASMKERIDIINQYLDPKASSIANMNLQQFIASFIYIQEFEKIIREYDPYDPKMSGMRHEMLSTVIMDGVEIFGVKIPDAVIEEKNFSFKYISKAGKAGSKGINKETGKLASYAYPAVEGSFYNFLELMSEGDTVVYLLCLKSAPVYEFKAFNVTPDNFMSILNTQGKFKEAFKATHQLTDSIKTSVGLSSLNNKTEINLSYYDDIVLFRNDKQKLAKLIMELIGKDLYSMILFTPDFLKTLANNTSTAPAIYSPQISYYERSTKNLKQVTWGGVPYNHQGTLVIDPEKMQDIKDAYKGTIYEKVFDFFKEGETLLTNVRDFLSKNTTVEESMRIKDSIEEIKQKFTDISSEAIGPDPRQMELEFK